MIKAIMIGDILVDVLVVDLMEGTYVRDAALTESRKGLPIVVERFQAISCCSDPHEQQRVEVGARARGCKIDQVDSTY